MIMPALLLALVSTPPSAATESPEPGGAAGAFKRLTHLVGDWEGTFTWSGARSEKGPVRAAYHLVGHGSALIEELIMEGEPVMASVYHLDGDALRMTHYCGAQNQPRLRASTLDLGSGRIEFEFVDITNLPAPDAPHVTGFSIDVGAPDRLGLRFLFTARGRESVEQLSLTRVGSQTP